MRSPYRWPLWARRLWAAVFWFGVLVVLVRCVVDWLAGRL
jgi:hypothetical protein